MQNDSTPWLLEQWGRWAFQAHGLRLTYPGMTPFRRLNKTTSAPSPAISDAVAQEVDYAVSQVCHDSPAVGNALVRRYLLREHYHKIGRVMKRDRRTIARLVQIGEAAVAEVLDAD